MFHSAIMLYVVASYLTGGQSDQFVFYMKFSY